MTEISEAELAAIEARTKAACPDGHAGDGATQSFKDVLTLLAALRSSEEARKRALADLGECEALRGEDLRREVLEPLHRRQAEAAEEMMRAALNGLLAVWSYGVSGDASLRARRDAAVQTARTAAAARDPGASLLARLATAERAASDHAAAYHEMEQEHERVTARLEAAEKALRPFAEVGQWLFARRDVPDDATMVRFDGINAYKITLTRGHFKAAYAALAPSEPAS